MHLPSLSPVRFLPPEELQHGRLGATGVLEHRPVPQLLLRAHAVLIAVEPFLNLLRHVGPGHRVLQAPVEVHFLRALVLDEIVQRRLPSRLLQAP